MSNPAALIYLIRAEQKYLMIQISDISICFLEYLIRKLNLDRIFGPNSQILDTNLDIIFEIFEYSTIQYYFGYQISNSRISELCIREKQHSRIFIS